MLVVEDLHWADRPTLALLRYLVRHPRLDHLLVVATLRDDEFIGERAELIERLAPRANTTTLRLEGFGEHEVRALIRSAALPETMPEIIDASGVLQEITGGNPYFLRELLRELDEEPAKVDGEAGLARTLATIAPAGVRALVDRRLDRLTDRGRAVLDAAAVLGRDLSVDLLATMCGVSQDVVFDALEESLAARLLVEDFGDVDGYLFPHMLTRNAVYAAIDPDRRMQLHRRAGEALERLPTRAPDAVSTWRATSARRRRSASTTRPPSTRSRPVTTRPPVSRSRRRRGGTSGHPAAHAPAGRERRGREDVLALGRAYANDGRLEHAHEAFLAAADEARRAGDAALFADVALAADGQWISVAEFRRGALPLLEEALVAIGDDDPVRRVQILNGIASDLYYSDPDREGEVARDAVALAARLDDPVPVRPRSWRSTAGTRTGPRRGASGWISSCRAWDELVRAGGCPDVSLLLLRAMLADLIENAWLPTSTPASTSTSGRRRSRRARATSTGPACCVRRRRRCTATSSRASNSRAAPRCAGGSSSRRRPVRTSCSDSSSGSSRRGSPKRWPTSARSGVGGARCSVRARRSSQSRARRSVSRIGPRASHATRSVPTARRFRPTCSGWPASRCSRASRRSRRDRSLLQLVGELMAPCEDHVVVFGVGGAVLGSGHHWLGLVDEACGRPELARRRFAEAEAIAEGIGAPYWRAEAMVATARVLRAGGRSRDEREIERLVGEARRAGRPWRLRPCPRAGRRDHLIEGRPARQARRVRVRASRRRARARRRARRMRRRSRSGRATPNALFDVVRERVLEALDPDRALAADLLRCLDTETVRGEELTGVRAAAAALEHPRVFVGNRWHVRNLSATSGAAVVWSGRGRSSASAGTLRGGVRGEPTEIRDLAQFPGPR